MEEFACQRGNIAILGPQMPEEIEANGRVRCMRQRLHHGSNLLDDELLLLFRRNFWHKLKLRSDDEKSESSRFNFHCRITEQTPIAKIVFIHDVVLDQPQLFEYRWIELMCSDNNIRYCQINRHRP